MKLDKKIYQLIENLQKRIENYLRYHLAKKQLKKFIKPYKFHVGCGSVRFNNWINLDIENKRKITDIVWNVSNGFSFVESESCSLIYCEHFLEHLKIEDAKLYLSDSYRVLQSGGTIRIAMPSLEYIIDKYQSENWKDQDWLKWDDFNFIQTRAEMMNISFRWWGHEWLYDREELHRRLNDAGFTHIQDVLINSSNIKELQNRETRKDSFLIVEAQKLI